MAEKLVLIDGHSILNRAFYGMPDLTNPKGVHVGAVQGFLNILFRLIADEAPDYLAVAFDLSAPTFRHKKYAEYKGTRAPMDPALREQVPIMKELLADMGIAVVTKEGFEADDILGTLARAGEAKGLSVIVLSGDKDLFQLATERICIRIPRTKKGETTVEDFYAKDVLAAYQVTPSEFIDVKALMGDASDNIPGVLGIGEKTAIKIISQYHSIEEAILHADEGKPTKVMTNFKEQYETAQFSKWLATIKTDVELDVTLDEMRFGDIYTDKALETVHALGLKKLAERFEANRSSEVPAAQEAAFRVRELSGQDDIKAYLDRLSESGAEFAFKLAIDGEVLGIAVCAMDEAGDDEITYFDADETALNSLRGLLKHTSHPYYTFDLKSQLPFLMEENAPIEMRASTCDLEIAAYLINPLIGEYPYTAIAGAYAGLNLPERKALLGKQTLSEAKRLGGESREAYRRLLCAEVFAAKRTAGEIMERLAADGMTALYREIEMPLVFVLSDMERAGIYTDRAELSRYSQELSGAITALEQEIYALAGEQFNINSPKQLGVILFEKLKLPSGKKTKTGYSTAVDVLESLAPDYPIVSKVLQYRGLSKLKSTYADGLQEYIGADERIHTSFNQTITATGRLSSTEPNLQNIPIRTEQGRLIRKVFKAGKGKIFVDSDYSQVELRILAHMSGDENLIGAYNASADIHRMTASWVFKVPPEEVTDQLRRNAKAVNFGIVYGISTFGLSEDLSISRAEAKNYIESYFESFPGVKRYLDAAVSEAKEKGCITTLYGRRRPIPELKSSNFMTRNFGERIAMNSPIQGTAADIMKIAMIRIHDRLMREVPGAKMLIQVHDEVLIEAEEADAAAVKRVLEEEMTAAAQLSVKLDADVNCGHDWFEAH